uniref:Uncharacterized protein n=1 Tax=Avena sativa TaxID=4498 RepID=A0ACD5ZQE9_AVESA
MASSKGDAAKTARMAAGPGRLPPELLANIYDRLEFLDRIAFAAVFAAYCDDDNYDHVFEQRAPWLLLPCCEETKNPATATLFSVADRRAATVRAPDPALRGHTVLGSSRGWLATADTMGQIYVVNPASGEQQALPDITTMGSFLSRLNHHWFSVWMKPFLTARFGCEPPFGDYYRGPRYYGKRTFSADEMAGWFYRKVVLSTSPSDATAMLILDRIFGAPAFATSEDAVWRLAPSRDGVEDAIHHDGRFYSVSYTGVVEAWEHNAESGAYTSTAASPRLTITNEEEGSRKYLAMASGGRLMVVVKHAQVIEKGRKSWADKWRCSFEVHFLGDDGQWKEKRDIGDSTLFVGLNNSLCVPTRGRPEIQAGCIYFTDDELREAALRKRNELGSSFLSYRGCVRNDDKFHDHDMRAIGVYSLKDGTVKKMEALGKEWYERLWMPPVWITPYIP